MLLSLALFIGLISSAGVAISGYLVYRAQMPGMPLLIAVLGTTLVLIWLAAALMIMYIRTRILRPLQTLTNGLTTINRGNLNTLLKVSADNEFDHLTGQVNTLTVSLFEAQQALIDAMEENTRLYQETDQNLKLRIKELSSLQKVSRKLNSTLVLKKLLEVVLTEAVRATEANFGNIALYSAMTGTLRTQARQNWPSETQSLTEDLGMAGVVGRVVRANRPEIIADVSKDPDYVPLIPATRSEMIVPIHYTGRVEGVISLESTQLAAFTPEQLQYVQALADQAAVAIRNARLVDRLNKFTETLELQVGHRTEELKQESNRVDTLYNLARELSSSLNLNRVLNRALILLKQNIPFEQSAILLIDDVTGDLRLRSATQRSRPLPSQGQTIPYAAETTPIVQVLENKRAVIENNLRQEEDWLADGHPIAHRSILAAPLTTDFEMLGVLALFHPETDYFTQAQLRLITAATPIIATAINNANLYNLISDQVHRLGILLNQVQAEGRKNKAIVEGIADGVLMLDEDLRIQLINPAAATILGRPKNEFENKHPEELLPAQLTRPEDHLLQELCRLIQTHLPLTDPNAEPDSSPHQIQIENKVILVILAKVSITPNVPASALIVLRDISREAELDRIRNEFISTVSHELRTPMTSIKGYTDLLSSDKIGPLTETQRKFVQVIKNNANRLTALVNDILDVSRIDTGRIKLNPHFINLTTLIQDVLTGFSNQIKSKSLRVTTHLPADLPPIFADSNRVTQVLINLLSNAIKYSPEKEQIIISASIHPQFMQIDIRDTGVGIPQEDIPYIFDRFYRSERDENYLVEGTGLGLSIVQLFVEMMGGTVWLESELNKGSTFSFTLPLQDLRYEEDSIAAEVANRRTILVVDDNPDILNVLKRHLELQGYYVLATTSGRHALNLARQHQPALITLDILLDDVEGFEILETLKKNPDTRDIPVVMASFLKDAAKESVELGAADYLVKPFDRSEVLETVQRLITVYDENGQHLTIETILIADDDKDTVNWLKTELTAQDFKVLSAYNGEEALLLARDRQPDLILLDLKMPGLSGTDVIQALKQEVDTANIPIIVMTGHTVERSGETIKMLGAKQLFTKPFSITELVAQIKDLEKSGD